MYSIALSDFSIDTLLQHHGQQLHFVLAQNQCFVFFLIKKALYCTKKFRESHIAKIHYYKYIFMRKKDRGKYNISISGTGENITILLQKLIALFVVYQMKSLND